MLKAGGPAAMRHALSASRQGPFRATHRGLQVVCGSGQAGDSGLPGLAPDQQRRALTVPSGAQHINWREFGDSLGGSLIVDNASHKEEVHKAVKEGTLSFGFSAGGCLFPYYIGCAGALMDAGILTDKVKLGGASAGSLLAACIKSGMPLDSLVEQNMKLMHDLRQGGTRGRLGAVLRTFLQDNLPEDAHLTCKDLAYVAVTRVSPIARPVLVSDFHDRPDLIQALMTSCHIPFWMDGSPFTEFRGERHCDGGLTNFIPLPPATLGVRVCCFPSQQLSPVYRIGISPDSFEPWGYSLRQTVQWAFEPAEETIIAALIDKGKKDAEAWMESMELLGAKQQAQQAQQQDLGHVAAAKEAAVGTSDSGAQQQAQQAGHRKLEERAQRDGAEPHGGAALAAEPADAGGQAAVPPKEEQAVGAMGAQLQAVEAVAEQQDAGASRERQLEEAQRALHDAEEKEGEGGNLWAKALAAAGIAASAAAVAVSATG